MTYRADRIRQVIATASWAPSGDNTQPWYFEFKGDTVRVHLIPDLDNPVLNFKLSGTYIAHGALIENLLLAAPLFELSAQMQLLPEGEDSHCTAEITFRDGAETSSPLAQVIRERHTNRKRYSTRAIGRNVLMELCDAAQGVSDTACSFIDDKSEIQTVAHASALMEQVALETPKLRELFLGDILWNSEDNKKGIPGLYIKSMELPLPAQLLFKRLRNATFATMMNRLGFSRAARKINGRLYASSSALGLISMTEESPRAYLGVGRATQRVWLSATNNQLAFQPVTGILFLARSVENGSAEELLPEHLTAIKEASTQIRSAFSLKEEKISGMMFRIGYASAVTARSFRHAPDIR